jgi:hypothetical protein
MIHIAIRGVVAGLSAACVLVLAGCGGGASQQAGRAQVVQPATPAQKSALFDRVASLAGTWEMTDEEGKTHVASVFTVSSGGNVVREVMFPGAPHEMTNVYHMDGDDLVVTHYCAVGNQPRMRSTAAGGTSKDRIHFAFDSVTNLTSNDQTYMGDMTLVFVDANMIRQEWKSFKGGSAKADPGHSPSFELRRATN